MRRTKLVLTALLLAAVSVCPAATEADIAPDARAPEVTLDTDSLGGYKGDYVVIYNPDLSCTSALSTGNMQYTIQTDIAPLPDHSVPSVRDVDQEAKRHCRSFCTPGPLPPDADFQVGSRQSFCVDPYYSPMGQCSLVFECLAAGEHCCVWSLPSDTPYMPALQHIDPELADALAAEFDSCYQLMQNCFGGAGYPAWYSSSKLNILCYDIEDGWEVAGGSFIGGYFSPFTCVDSFAPIINIDVFPTIWQGEGEPSLDTARRVLVHEYAHLLTYAQTGGTEDWLEEVIASAAEEVCYPGSCITARVPYFSRMNGGSMYDWDGLMCSTNALYARGALFGQYLYTRFGNEVFGRIIQGISAGLTIPHAVYSASGATISDLVLQFNIASVVNSSEAEGGNYGFALQPGFDPALYGVDDPYSLLPKDVYTSACCTVRGGGAIVVKPKYGAYYPPADASPGLVYVGIKLAYPSYNVVFCGMEGEVLSSQIVMEGCAAEPPEPPEVEGFTFIKWSRDHSHIECDTVLYALYAPTEMLLRGDADCNGAIGFADITCICVCLNGLTTPENAFYYNADADENGRVDFNDAAGLCMLFMKEQQLSH